MARTTPTRELAFGPTVVTRTSKTGPPFKRMFYGRELPAHVVYAELFRDMLHDEVQIRWVCTDQSRHSMPFEQTDEGVIAVLTAMKLTC